eukprot:TRINITY_DN39166_c0_g1_i1.p1 TRINITY_DN39166_c0_g1~~TRINITY_DN39166_c0_g1_i1.p1  ORF type:complete len:3092 (+),score=891.72 TRINITY_DN39166_c0_g1_i1:58-9333(+)
MATRDSAAPRRPSARVRLVLLLLLVAAPAALGSYSGVVQITSGYVCGYQYNVTEAPPPGGASVENCETMCSENTWCNAFTYWTDGQCRLYTSCPVLHRYPETRTDGNDTYYAATYLLRRTVTYVEYRTSSFADGQPRDVIVDHSAFTAGFTVDLWVKADGGKGTKRVVASTLSSLRGYRIYASTSDMWAFDTANTTDTLTITGTTPVGVYTSAKSTLATVQYQVWTRLTACYDATGGLALFYVNGVIVGSQIVDLATSTWESGLRLRLGADTSGAWVGHLTGELRDIRVWAAAYDAHSVDAILAPYPTYCPSAAAPPGIALATGHDQRDHGADLGGKCLYLTDGRETCSSACARIVPGSTCDSDGVAGAAKSTEHCEAAMQRLGVLYQGVGDYWQDMQAATRLAAPTLYWEGYWCRHPRGVSLNLGTFSTAATCAAAVFAHPSCGWSFQWSPGNPQWGCLCCEGNRLPTQGHADVNFNVYILSFEGRPGYDDNTVGQDRDGCTWSEQRHRLTAAAGADCGTPVGTAQPAARNGTRLRACVCTPYEATETVTLKGSSDDCGPGMPVCDPCPRILFKEPSWETISWTAACAGSSAMDHRKDVGGLARCRAACESYRYTNTPCGGVDYWDDTDDCVLYTSPCAEPTEVGNASSSHRMVLNDRSPVECSPDGLLSDLPTDQLGYDWNINDTESDDICSCRKHCMETQPLAVYGALRSNVTMEGTVHYYCSCYYKCAGVVSTSTGPLWGQRDTSPSFEFASNVTTFAIGIPRPYLGCMSAGGARSGKAIGGFSLSVLEMQHRRGLTLSAFVRRDATLDSAPAVERPAGGADKALDLVVRRSGGTSRRWGLRHLVGTKWQWDICEFVFYDNDDCTGSNSSFMASSTVSIYPPAPDRPASLSVDGRTDTCSAVDCGEPPTGHGCSAGVASYHVDLPSPISARCVKVFQYANPDTMSPEISVESESPSGVMTEQWRCERLQPGKWQQCSRGTGLLYFEAEEEGVTWMTARTRCRDLGGDLASIHSEGTNEAALRLIRAREGYWDTFHKLPNRAWIGAKRDSTGGRDAATFKWSDESDWKWATITSTYVNENVSRINDYEDRDYSNWACGNQHPPTGRGWPYVRTCVVSSEIAYGAEQGDHHGSWSNGFLTQVGSASGWQTGGWRDGRVHGPFDHRVKSVSKTFYLPASATTCTVKYRSWSLYTRDNEENQLWLDGTKVWYSAPGHVQSGCSTGWTRQWHHRFHFGEKYFGGPRHPGPEGGTPSPTDNYPACYLDNEVTVSCSDTLVVKFASGTDQDYGDESWAFSNFELSVDDCREPVPESGNYQPSGRKHPSWIDYGGDCAFMFKKPEGCAEEGTWGAVSCGTRLPGFVCNVTAPRAPDSSFPNGTATKTITKTVPVVGDGVPEQATTLFSCGNGPTEDTVSLYQTNQTMTYEVTWSLPSSWPSAAPAASTMTVPRFIEADDAWRRLTVQQRHSGATTIWIDHESAQTQKPYAAATDELFINPSGSPWPGAGLDFDGPFAGLPQEAPLALWLRADKLPAYNASTTSAGRVVRWDDKSGNGRDVFSYRAGADPLTESLHATGEGSEATGGGSLPAPEFLSHGAGASGWHSVRFAPNGTATPLTLPDSASPYFNNTGFLVCAVARPIAPSTAHPFLIDHGSYDDDKHWGIMVGTDKIVARVTPSQGGAELKVWTADLNPPGAVDDGAHSPGKGYMLVCLRVLFDNKVQLRVNGHVAAEKSVTMRGLFPSGHSLAYLASSQNLAYIESANEREELAGPLTIGMQSTLYNATANDTTDRYFQGDLAELVIYKDDLGDSGTEAVEQALATKYFGGPFVRLPSDMPRARCALGSPVSVNRTADTPAELGGNVHFEGSFRQLGLWNAEISAVDHRRLTADVVDADDIAQVGLIRSVGCTSACVPLASASGPSQAASGAKWVTGTPPGDCEISGSIKVDEVPNGDQAIVTYGGLGCGPGGLTVWAFPSQGGFGLAVGEWGGHAIRTEVGYALNSTHSFKVDFDVGVGPPETTTTKIYYGAELLTHFTAAQGYWLESPKEDQCGHRPHATGGYKTDGYAAQCIVAGKIANDTVPEAGSDPARSSAHPLAVLRSPEVILSARSALAVETYGAATSTDVTFGRPLEGFAGIALRDSATDTILLQDQRTASAINASSQEILGFTPNQLRAFSGRRVTVELIDGHCLNGCTLPVTVGWIGFTRVTWTGVDVKVAQARIIVDNSIQARGQLAFSLAPIEAGGVALLARCHNDPYSGSLQAAVTLSAGCASNVTLDDVDNNMAAYNPSVGVSGEEVLFADVDGETHAGADFWWKKCQAIPRDAAYLKLVMGDVTDYFKPVSGASFCTMLLSNRKHLWTNAVSKVETNSWTTPEYYGDVGPQTLGSGDYEQGPPQGQGFPVGPSAVGYGGSSYLWPRSTNQSFWVDDPIPWAERFSEPRPRLYIDERLYLPFWGPDGGCCHMTLNDGASWKRAFKFYYVVQGAGRARKETATVTPTATETPEPGCYHHFTAAAADYYAAGAGGPGAGWLGPMTFGGEITLAAWVRLTTSSPEAGSQIIDIANAPRDKRVSLGFYSDSGSIVYRVEQYGPFASTSAGLADPEKAQIPLSYGAGKVPNEYIGGSLHTSIHPTEYVGGEYLQFVGCYSEWAMNGFGGGAHARYWGPEGGGMDEAVASAIKGGYTYVALAQLPPYDGGGYQNPAPGRRLLPGVPFTFQPRGGNGGRWIFNVLTTSPDLPVDACRSIACNGTGSVCGCAGGLCGPYALASGRCDPSTGLLGNCSLRAESWAVWKRVWPNAPDIPYDGKWHHVAVIHEFDTTETLHLTEPIGTATLYVDFVAQHSGKIILPTSGERVDCFVGRSNVGDPDFVGDVKDVYVWNKALTLSEVKAIAQRTLPATHGGVQGWSDSRGYLVRAGVQHCAAPSEGYGQCVSQRPSLPGSMSAFVGSARIRDPRMCNRPQCECSFNGFRCAVSAWGRDYMHTTQWAEPWGAKPFDFVWGFNQEDNVGRLGGGGVPGLVTKHSRGRCYVNTDLPEGCVCEGTITFYSFDPRKVRKSLTCGDVLHAFGGKLSPSLPQEFMVPTAAGDVLCPNVESTRLY